jgi:hypothetical protein
MTDKLDAATEFDYETRTECVISANDALIARVTRLERALREIVRRSYTAEYHDGTSTGPDAIRELKAIARAALNDETGTGEQ